MKKVFTIYRDDLKSIVTNWATAAIMIALMVLPSLYAWFNIKASWDPYSNTRGIPIAISSDDTGTVLKNQHINIGNEIIHSMKQNKSLGWKFVDTKEANNGVKEGKYFASITIPKDFSAKIATVITENPEKATLIYTVNEKINAVAPKITAKGATGIKDEVSKNFVKTANGVIFSIFNELGIDLQKNLPDIEKLKTMIFWLNDHLSEAEKMINTASDDADSSGRIVTELQKNVTEVKGIIDRSRELSNQINSYLDLNKESFANLIPTIKQNLLYLQQTAAAIEQITGILQSTNASIAAKRNAVADGINRISSFVKMNSLLISLFEKLNALGNNSAFNHEIAQLNQLQNIAQGELTNLKTIQSQLSQGLQPAQQLIDNMYQLSKEASTFLGDILNSYDSQIAPKIAQLNDIAKNVPTKANEFFSKADGTLSEINKILNDASTGIAIGKRDITLIKAAFPEVSRNITNLANQIREFDQSNDIRSIIALLKNDVKKESDFFAEPVLLKEKRLFPIPNYGSAMSPFFTTLALWVGATLLISLIPVDLHNLPETYHPNHVYFGRYLTFLTIALCQSIIVTTGDLFLLHTFVADKLWFVLFGLIISTVFMLIIYTLVSIFGNVGKGLAIVLLVLQISGSGGTFPIEVMPTFFQRLHPFLPFSYAISLMREAVGGMQWSVAKNDLSVLLFITIITLLFGAVLKEPIGKWSSGFRRKAKESRLIH